MKIGRSEKRKKKKERRARGGVELFFFEEVQRFSFRHLFFFFSRAFIALPFLSSFSFAFSFPTLCATMAGAAPAAAAAATASEHTRGTLVWVRPAAAAAASGKAHNAGDAEEWVKATVARVLDGGATLEVELEGSSNEDEPPTTTISVSAADAPLQNPASRLGVEVRKEGELRARWNRNKKRKDKESKARLFSYSKGGRGFLMSLCSFCSSGRRETSLFELLVD